MCRCAAGVNEKVTSKNVTSNETVVRDSQPSREKEVSKATIAPLFGITVSRPSVACRLCGLSYLRVSVQPQDDVGEWHQHH